MDQLSYPAWLENTGIYQIFVPSFQDSNGDGIGDLPGILSRLDHIRELGFETIWLSPIYESPFRDAGYDVTDHRKIAPRYGTMDDFEALLAAAHERGMRLILDFVPGHTSDEHPWFRESSSETPNRLTHRYVWTDTTFYIGEEKTGPGQFIVGHAKRDGNYLANFFYFQPALNYGYADPHPDRPWQLSCDHPAVRETRAEMESIMRFWLDKGVDGFRVDMAGHLVKGNDPSRIQEKTVELWQGVREWWDREYPEALLIAEWSDPSSAIEAGFHADFMIHFNEAGYMKLFRGENKHTIIDRDERSFFRPDGGGSTEAFFREFERHRQTIAGRGLISLPTGNHDLPRYSLDRSEAELKGILSFLFSLPAIPTIYYGDEIGLRAPADLPSKEGAYRRTQARTPMQWDDGENAGFSTADATALYLPVDPAPDRPTVAAQREHPDSLLSHLKQLLRLRHRHPELGARGSVRVLENQGEAYPCAYIRELNGARSVVAVNPLSEKAALDLPAGLHPEPAIFGEARVTETGNTRRLELDAYGFAICPIEASEPPTMRGHNPRKATD